MLEKDRISYFYD
ncbi:hypothetical protein CFC21_023694, partial [Triticum aestivum]